MNEASYIVLQLQALAHAETGNDIGIQLNGSAPFSVDAWVSLDGLCSHAHFLSKEGVFAFGLAGDALVFEITGYPPVYSNAARQPLTEADWHYLCATYAGGQVRLYIDGTFNVLQAISGRGNANANPFRIGEDLQAQLSSVRVYNRELDANTVKANMFNGPDPASIAAWFDFAQAPPVDRGPRHLPITLSAGAEMQELTPSLGLGSTAYAEPHRDEHVNPGGGQVDPYTVQGWVHIEGKDPPHQAIFANGNLDEGSGIALLLNYDVAAAAFRVVSQRGPLSGGIALTSTAVIRRGVWANVATTFDGATLKIYVDSALAGSRACGPIPVSRLFGAPMIGAAPRQGQPISTTTLQGFVSRLEIWQRALTAAEVTQYMQAAPPVESTDLQGSYDFTTTPARNRRDGDPVGLVDGAEMTTEVSHAGAVRARPTTIVAAGLDERASGERAGMGQGEQLDEQAIADLLAQIDFAGFLAEHEQTLRAAATADAGLFDGDSDAQQLIRDAWDDTIERLRSDPRSLPFLLTSHVIGEDYVLLCHTRRGAHVAMRARVADLDPCTQWKVELAFCIVAGLMDAFFGISARLTPSATDFIGRVLRNPGVMAQMGRGQLMTASGIYGILYALWSGGFLKPLISLVVDVGFWTLARIAAKLLLKLIPGLGQADVIASLVATAATFVFIYTQRRPAQCSALPAVDVAAIKFNYDTTGVAVDALSIRRNYAKHVPVAEWTKGETKPEQSPAAYAIASTTGKTVTIQAKFVISDPTITQAQVRADGGGVLGAIDPFTVTFKNGVSDPDFVTLSLPHHTLATNGVGRTDISWTWYYKTLGDWTQLTVTQHRIYVVLAMPTTPWTQSATPSSDTQVPWADLLDYACVWANGAKTAGEAAGLITQKVNGGIGLSYDVHGGASAYTAWGVAGWAFLSTEFLKFLGGQGGKGGVVNCTDCATIVTTFANALGCNLYASQMHASGGGGFYVNKMIAIGGTTWSYPFVAPNPPAFSYHEVAWTGTASYSDGLYDACLKVDSGNNPWNWTDPSIVHTPQLPQAMKFSTLGANVSVPIAVPFTASSYRERLATNDAAGILSCLPQGAESYSNGGRRELV